jgi:N-formylglutamate amidohydrolase
MTDCFSFEAGSGPLLISIPHDGRELAPGMANRMTESGLALPDTDWHVRLLYDFATTLGAGIIAANFSRYVIDLNRSGSDDPLYAGQLSTGLCPAQTFAGDDIYMDGDTVEDDEQQSRLERYWQPYHSKIEDELSRLKGEFGYALLWDAHSIRTRVPGLFAGALPELNIGSDDGRSCSPILEKAVAAAALDSPCSSVLNGRFKGGHITRHFGRPQDNINALQLELAQHSYMDEASGKYDLRKSGLLQGTLRPMLASFLASADEITS